MERVLSLTGALVLLLASTPASSGLSNWVDSPVDFQETNVETPNPDRGLFKQIRVDNTLGFQVASDARNIRVYFVLDSFVDKALPSEELRKLGNSLTMLERAQQRAIIRFMYDYPSADVVNSGLRSRRAQTASPSMMTTHIRQLATVLVDHRRSVFAVESGLIGFWGEQHGDLPGKQTPAAVSAIVDQWLSALAGTEIQVLARYPKALRQHIISRPNLLTDQPRLGFWNDCLGAYDDENMDKPQFAVVEGETCALRPRMDYSCATMMSYFRSTQLDMLHSEYFRPVLTRWNRENCYVQLQKSLGYRYVVRGARLAADDSVLEIRIDNVGWGRSLVSRPLYLVYNGHRSQKIADLADLLPGSVNSFHVRLTPLWNWSQGVISLETADGVQFSNRSGNRVF